jgi:ribosomal protein S18 acetylase RimI-like enzyme
LRDVAAEDRWIRTEIPFNTSGREQMLRTALSAGDLVSFVAECDGAIAGELSVRMHGARASFGMAVALSARRNGIGRRLLAEALRWARSAHIAFLDLDVYAHNTAAIELYRASGFATSGAHKFEERRNGERWEIIPMTYRLRE